LISVPFFGYADIPNRWEGHLVDPVTQRLSEAGVLGALGSHSDFLLTDLEGVSTASRILGSCASTISRRCYWATGLGFLWLLLQLSEQAQEALWNRRGGLVFPQLAERTIHPIVGGFPSRTLFQ
jgi:hypothetical protein